MGVATPTRTQAAHVSLADALDTSGLLREHHGVWVALFELGDWRPWLDEAGRILDPSEQHRCLSRRNPTDRERLVLCYALRRLLLGRVMGCDARAVPLERDPAGCPRIAGANLFTSLSHAGDAAAVAITATGPVGIDIEPASRAPVMADIAGRVCHADDVIPEHGTARELALLDLWVRKEAYLKACATGLEREMDTFAAPRDAMLPLPGGASTQVRMLDAGEACVAAGAAPPPAIFHVVWMHPQP